MTCSHLLTCGTPFFMGMDASPRSKVEERRLSLISSIVYGGHLRSGPRIGWSISRHRLAGEQWASPELTFSRWILRYASSSQAPGSDNCLRGRVKPSHARFDFHALKPARIHGCAFCFPYALA